MHFSSSYSDITNHVSSTTCRLMLKMYSNSDCRKCLVENLLYPLVLSAPCICYSFHGNEQEVLHPVYRKYQPKVVIDFWIYSHQLFVGNCSCHLARNILSLGEFGGDVSCFQYGCRIPDGNFLNSCKVSCFGSGCTVVFLLLCFSTIGFRCCRGPFESEP